MRTYLLPAFAALILTTVLFPASSHASWILRAIVTPPELAGTLVGMEQGASIEDLAYSAHDHNHDHDNDLKTAPRRAYYGLLAPARDVERSTSFDDFNLLYTEPDSTLTSNSSSEQMFRVAKLEKGQTLTGFLSGFGVAREDRNAIAAAVADVYNLKKLQADTEFDLRLNARIPVEQVGRLHELYFEPDSLTKVRLTRDADGNYVTDATNVKLTKQWVMARGKIEKGSLWMDGKAANLPNRIIANVIHAHRHAVNVDRSLRKGDEFSVLFEAHMDPDKRIHKSGEILYTSLTVKGKKHELYWFENGKQSSYFTPKGRSTRRGGSLLQKPIKGARISSRYGMRMHPILKRRKMHAGVDYAARTGTPVYAAGSGTVVSAGWKGGYGKHIRLSHAGPWGTSYSHLNGYAKGIRAGKRVRQGQLIGYVGSTGRSTGPHLHYEVIHNGKKVDPLKVKVAKSFNLGGNDKKKFQDQVYATNKIINRAMSSDLAKL